MYSSYFILLYFPQIPSMFGSTEVQEEPRRLLKSKTFTKVAVGDTFTIALDNNGNLFGWGSGFYGKESSSREPIPLALPEGCPGIKGMYLCIYMYIYVCVCLFVYIYIFICTDFISITISTTDATTNIPI